eukprot:3357455-Pleurochrysis_carterae.AAC.2
MTGGVTHSLHQQNGAYNAILCDTQDIVAHAIICVIATVTLLALSLLARALICLARARPRQTIAASLRKIA